MRLYILNATFLTFLLIGNHFDVPKNQSDQDHERDRKSKLEFILNQNQFHTNVKFACPLGALDKVYLESNCITYLMHDNHAIKEAFSDHHSDEKFEIEGLSYKTVFENANTTSPKGYKAKDHYLNYFIGNDKSKWASKVPVYKIVEYPNLYDGIDLIAYSTNDQFKYDFVISPGADANSIRLKYEGIDKIRIVNDELVISGGEITVKESKPYAYQVIRGVDVEVKCNYSLDGNSMSFTFPERYNNSYDLIIDPTLIVATVVGGLQYGSYGYCGTYDNAGNIYTAGTSLVMTTL